MNDVITQHLDVWTSVRMTKNTAGRGSSDKQTAYGIKKLRELILELAVRGKLVPQEPNDEPASVLLEKIAEEKARLIKEGKVKAQENLPEISEDEKPFQLPDAWVWTRLGNVTDYGMSDKVEPGDLSDDTWVLELEDVEKETSKLLQKIRYAERQFRSSKNRFGKNDVIYGKLRPYLDKVIIADEEGVCTTEMIPVRGYDKITSNYLRLVMKSPYFIKYADESTHGMNLPRLGTEKARLALFPLIPENEQQRIVAKVEELMALCDQLEQQQTDSSAAHQALVETLLGTLTQSADQAEFAVAWQRIAEHFDTLFTTEHSIYHLKQTILQLAVMGKLVPQDPNEEPASVLLEKIAKQKTWLAKEGTIKKVKYLPATSEYDPPFPLPNYWIWTQAENICEIIIDCPHSTPIFENSGIICLDTNAFKAGELIPHKIRYVSEETYQERVLRLKPRAGDVVFAREGSVGASVIIPEGMICCLGQRVMLFRPMKYVLSTYFSLSISEPSSLSRLLSLHKGIGAKHVNVADMRNVMIPLPPLAEQHRIVAKVDELMALCDTLKARINEAQATQIHLADVIVEQAVA